MSRSYGLVEELIRDGRVVWSAFFEETYRHNARRLYGPIDFNHWPTEEAAVAALKREAGGPIEITTYYVTEASIAAAMGKRKVTK